MTKPQIPASSKPKEHCEGHPQEIHEILDPDRTDGTLIEAIKCSSCGAASYIRMDVLGGDDFWHPLLQPWERPK